MEDNEDNGTVSRWSARHEVLEATDGKAGVEFAREVEKWLAASDAPSGYAWKYAIRLENPLLDPSVSKVHAGPPTPQVSLSEVLSALSYALDLTEGQVSGHTVRSCIIGMRIAEELGLSSANRSALYYALLLKDAGCSSNATRMASIFGSDDRYAKPRMKVVDWHDRFRLALKTAATVGHGKSVIQRARHFVHIARSGEVTRELIALRCDRGADIARRLGFPQATAEAIRALDEHWCGLGYSRGLAAEQIPLLARISNIAQTVDAFHSSHGREVALRVIRRRTGTWFDPGLSRVVLGLAEDASFWALLQSDHAREAVVALEPPDQLLMADQDKLDEVARAFADIIDAKSPYTFNHSVRVAAAACHIAAEFGMSAAEQRRILRAGLLHDIGKLGVSSQILNKEGQLTRPERAEIERHPRYTLEILSRVTAFGPFGWTAATHHERLDGSGYPWGMGADQLDDAARLMCVADVFDALISDRPYRAGMPRERAFSILHSEADTKLSRKAIDALETWAVSGVHADR